MPLKLISLKLYSLLMNSNKSDIQNWFLRLFTAIFTYLTQLAFANRSSNMDSIEKNFSEHFSSEEKKGAMASWKAKVPLKIVREQCKISEDQKIKEIKSLWIIKMDKSKYLKKLMDSMPRRLEEVIARQDASTKY
jgi:hypothetical protein